MTCLCVCGDRAITGLSVTCIPSPASALLSRLSVDYLYNGIGGNPAAFKICSPIFWTRCESDATVEERCPASSENPPNLPPLSAWKSTAACSTASNPTCGCVPTNTAQCCIWSQAFPGESCSRVLLIQSHPSIHPSERDLPIERAGAPLVRDGVCENVVGGGIDLSGGQIAAIPSGAFDKVGSPR